MFDIYRKPAQAEKKHPKNMKFNELLDEYIILKKNFEELQKTNKIITNNIEDLGKKFNTMSSCFAEIQNSVDIENEILHTSLECTTRAEWPWTHNTTLTMTKLIIEKINVLKDQKEVNEIEVIKNFLFKFVKSINKYSDQVDPK